MKLIEGVKTSGKTSGRLRLIDSKSSSLASIIEEDRIRKEKQRNLSEAIKQAEYYKEEADKASSFSGIVKETAKGTGKTLLELGKATARLPITIPTKTILTLNNQPSYVPQTKVEKFLVGNEPVQSYSQDQQSLQKFFEEKGLSKNTAFAASLLGGVLQPVLDIGTVGAGKIVTQGAKSLLNRVRPGTLSKAVDVIESSVGRKLSIQESLEMKKMIDSGAKPEDIARTFIDEKPTVVREMVPIPEQKRAEAIRQYMSTNVKLLPNQVDDFKKKPVGIDELSTEFDKDGNITLYRKGDLEPGKPQSYSLVQTYGQVPVKVNKNDILVNFNSAEIKELISKATNDEIARYENLRALEQFQNSETEVLAITRGEKIPKADLPGGTLQKESGVARQAVDLISDKEARESVQDLATYTGRNREEQATKVSQLINSDVERVKRIVYGDEALPDGFDAGSFTKVVSKYAEKTNDNDLLISLSRSPLASEVSEMASTLSQRVGISRVLKDIDDVIKSKIAKYEKRTGKTAKKSEKELSEKIKKETRKTISLKKAEDLLESLIC